MPTRDKLTVHVSFTPETLAMADTMAEEAVLPGDKADRSRLIRQLVVEAWKRRTEAILATARKPSK